MNRLTVNLIRPASVANDYVDTRLFIISIVPASPLGLPLDPFTIQAVAAVRADQHTPEF
jgi:hypothetical protein